MARRARRSAQLGRSSVTAASTRRHVVCHRRCGLGPLKGTARRGSLVSSLPRLRPVACQRCAASPGSGHASCWSCSPSGHWGRVSLGHRRSTAHSAKRPPQRSHGSPAAQTTRVSAARCTASHPDNGALQFPTRSRQVVSGVRAPRARPQRYWRPSDGSSLSASNTAAQAEAELREVRKALVHALVATERELASSLPGARSL
jgi:hypothetical protein